MTLKSALRRDGQDASSLAFVVCVFLALGPIVMWPLTVLLVIVSGGEFHGGVGYFLYTAFLMPLMWWFGTIVGFPLFSWVFTLAPTLTAAFLYWLVTKLLDRHQWITLDRASSRIVLSSVIGALVSCIAFSCIALRWWPADTTIPSHSWSFPFRQDLFVLVLVTMIGLVLGAVLGIVKERSRVSGSPN